MINRRLFIKQAGLGSLSVAMMPVGTYLMDAPEFTHLTILHTNDVHSRVDPFPMDGSRNQGMGGAARRAAMIEKVRSEEKNLLLFDSGDIFQGTPYYNFFNGELEFKLMSEMQYDLSTLGNHDFDNGIDGFHDQLKHASFGFVSTNYDFRDTILHDKVAEYKILIREDLKIGVFGLGIELEGLVPKELYKETRYMDPVTKANATASLLKNELDCDYVVCLSHLGYHYKSDRICDTKLAEMTDHIDLILGGHTHTFLKEPDIRKNIKGNPVIINQAGWGGILLGRIDVSFEKNKKNKCLSCKNIQVN